MKNTERNIIVYVTMLPPGAVESIRTYEKREKRKFRIMLLRDSATVLDTKLEALVPYQNELCAVTCRSESHMANFIRIIPHVAYVRTPTTESLVWATDKLEMRRRFKLLAPKFSPKYTIVNTNTKEERKRIIQKIGFPMIVKPTNLAQSLLVTLCNHEDESCQALDITNP